MKKIKWIILLLALLLISGVYIWHFRPTKKAVFLEEAQNIQQEYVLVKWTQTTEGTWIIIGDQNGMLDEPTYVEPQGNIPQTCIRFLWGDNTFVWYGDYRKPIMTILGNQHTVFYIEQWEVLYPINHNSVFKFLSKKYLYPYDTIKNSWL